MPRTAKDWKLDTKSARAKYPPRVKPYYRQVARGLTLGYIRRPFGPGSWIVRELVNGMHRTRIIGQADDVGPSDGADVLTFDQALKAAMKPAPTAAPPGRLTVAQAIDAYLTTLAGRSDHAKETRQRADKWIVPKLGKIRVARLTKTEVENWLAGMVKDDDPDDPDARRRSQDSANRILTILKGALNAAFADESNGLTSDAAWRRVKPFRNVGAAREDDFDSAQVRRLVGKARTFDPRFAELIEAGFLTGARTGELTGAKVGDFNAAQGTLFVDGKTGRRVVTLTSEAVRLFERVTKGRRADAIVFRRADGDEWGKSEHARPFKRAAALAKLPASASFYTLRHSHISRAIEAGMPLSLIAENCGTSLLMIQRNYAKVLANTRRDQVEKTAPRLHVIKGGRK